MTEGLARYISIVKEWELLYGKNRVFRFNLTEARLCCIKCGKHKEKMSRHHTGNDFFFAQMMPQHFAKRYIEFRKEDTAKLCDDCHRQAHHIYKPLLIQVWRELNAGGQRVITKEWCEKWMARFREEFNAWIKKPVRKRKRRRKRGSAPKREV
jgi:hypothetical protein